MFQKKFLMYPLAILLFLFGLDKLFLLPVFKDSFLQTGNSVFYYQRNLLFQRLLKERETAQNSLVLVYGDSRSYPYSELGIPEKNRKDWSLFNFSSPQSVPMYSYFWLQQVVKAKIKPSFVILSLSPESFHKKKPFINNPMLRHGVSGEFRKEIWEDIPFGEKWEFAIDQLFQVRAREINLSLFWKRVREKKLKEYTPERNPDIYLLNATKGEFLLYATLANPVEKLEKDAERIRHIYLHNFSIAETQYLYVEKFLRLARKESIPVIVVFPDVYEKYRKYYKDYQIDETWWNRIESLAQEEGARTLHVNRETTCKIFNDASHQSIFCFPEIMQKIWEKMGAGAVFQK